MAKPAHFSHPQNILLVTTAYAILSIYLYVCTIFLHFHFKYLYLDK